MLALRSVLRSDRRLINPVRATARSINYGHDIHADMMAESAKVTIGEYDEGGFVVNGINMRGGVALLPQMAMLWKPKRFEEITKESLTVFTKINPPIEILLLGCGSRIQKQLDPELQEYLKTSGIVVEYIDSLNACATFNILNAEERKVAAALLPLDPK